MKKVICLVFLMFEAFLSVAKSENFSCQIPNDSFLRNLQGEWRVESLDRISPGKYNTNHGISSISVGKEGCTLHENYIRKQKDQPYAVLSTIYKNDLDQYQRVYYDSEHSTVMVFKGEIMNDSIKMFWRNSANNDKMQVKFVLKSFGEDQFEWRTHLSVDYGKTWQLTHHWNYNRMHTFDKTDLLQAGIAKTIQDYHEGLIKNNPDLVKSVLGDQFVMWNGNYSSHPINWQAHMSLSGQELKDWPDWFVKEAGPYSNQFEIISIHTRANAAVVITRDSGFNKFRDWNNEQTIWLLGAVEGNWKILGYYLQNISNP